VRRVGPYEILGELGRGGMGVVFRARHTSTGKSVALKVLASDLGLTPEEVARFQREVELAQSLDHPRALSPLDAKLGRSLCYMALDLLPGGTLQDRLRAQGTLPLDDALVVATDLADTLAHAHARGVIHRDLKPSNVLFDAQGQAHLSDFGLARGTQSSRLTATGAFLGTPAYMAPEQALDSKRAGEGSDVYGLGAILYAMLTGRPPVEATGTQLQQALEAAMSPPPPPPRSLRPEVPLALDALVRRAISKEVEERQPSMLALHDELVACRHEEAPAPATSALARRAALVVVVLTLSLGALTLRPDPVPAGTNPTPTPSKPAHATPKPDSSKPSSRAKPPPALAREVIDLSAWVKYGATLTWWTKTTPSTALTLDLILDCSARSAVSRARVVAGVLRARVWSESEDGSYDTSPFGPGHPPLWQLDGHPQLEFELDLEAGELLSLTGQRDLRQLLAKQLQAQGTPHSPALGVLKAGVLKATWRALLAARLTDGFGRQGAVVGTGRLKWASVDVDASGFRASVVLHARQQGVLIAPRFLATLAAPDGADMGRLVTLNRAFHPYRSRLPKGYVLEIPGREPRHERVAVSLSPSLVYRAPRGCVLGRITERRAGFAFIEVEGWRRIQWGGAWGWVPNKGVQHLFRTPETVVVRVAGLNAREEMIAPVVKREGKDFRDNSNVYGVATRGQRFPVLSWNARRTWAQVWFAERKVWLCFATEPVGVQSRAVFMDRLPPE
jgi:serine/threonine protein kinase